MFQMYLDLDELDTVFTGRWFWSTRRFALARFRRRDHIGAGKPTLKDAIQDLVESETGSRPQGPICLLTNLSYFGYCFNPVSFYYCFDTSGEQVECVVAEVNNTPWGERRTYVLPSSTSVNANVLRFQPEKNMHVSPFMPMQIDYDWCFSRPEKRITVHMSNAKDGQRLFDAGLILERREISGASLAHVLFMYPLITVKVILAIYWQALRLLLKRVPLHAHPDKSMRAQPR